VSPVTTTQASGAALDWRDGVPVSRTYGDPYWSPEDGLAEARWTFLAGNGLPARMTGRARFAIGELGFGLGLNLLAAWTAWRAASGGVLRFVSVEAHPATAAEMARAHAAWPELAGAAAALRAAWAEAGEGRNGDTRLALPGLDATVLIGDAAARAAEMRGIEAWFLDGFAPARNPAMWSPDLLAAVARGSTPGATVATYSAAGAVRRGLAAAGFAMEKRPGFGRKREMLVGTLG
jgi:tRNA U34 5-methylaminomethyl-2-thiouridine-forming methyltransferase MnmC